MWTDRCAPYSGVHSRSKCWFSWNSRRRFAGNRSDLRSISSWMYRNRSSMRSQNSGSSIGGGTVPFRGRQDPPIRHIEIAQIIGNRSIGPHGLLKIGYSLGARLQRPSRLCSLHRLLCDLVLQTVDLERRETAPRHRGDQNCASDIFDWSEHHVAQPRRLAMLYATSTPAAMTRAATATMSGSPASICPVWDPNRAPAP